MGSVTDELKDLLDASCDFIDISIMKVKKIFRTHELFNMKKYFIILTNLTNFEMKIQGDLKLVN